MHARFGTECNYFVAMEMDITNLYILERKDELLTRIISLV